MGNGPGQPIRVGAMGRPTPGYTVALLDTVTDAPLDGPGEGEICLDLSVTNLALMKGYYGDGAMTAEACRHGYYPVSYTHLSGSPPCRAGLHPVGRRRATRSAGRAQQGLGGLGGSGRVRLAR